MKPKFILFVSLFAVFAMVLSACANSGSSTTPGATTTGGQGGVVPIPSQGAQSSGGSSGQTLNITGAGATFPFPLYSRWFYDYSQKNPDIKFNYQSIGSGGGIQQITSKTVDFGASDAILTSEQLNAAPGLQMFPTVAGAVVPVYNLSALKSDKPLVLNADTLSGIYLGKITKWNDPAIAALNPGVNLPNQDIIVVHRSDGSGTTFIFTSYLEAVNQQWASQVGSNTSVQWPVGLGGKGNEGVSGTVGQNDGAIGYVELAYAIQNKLSMVSMINKAGNTVQASIDTTQNALSDFGSQMPSTLAMKIVDAPGKNSWPIAGYTYMLLYMDMSSCPKAKALVDFYHWAQTNGSQTAKELDYVPLPANVQQLVFNKMNQMTCNGGTPVPTPSNP